MTAVIARRTEDAGHRPLPKEIASFRAKSYVGHMKQLGVHPSDYDKVYEAAVLLYNDNPNQASPFGVDFLVRAAKSMMEGGRKYTMYTKPERKAMVSCTSCQGSKISYKKVGNSVVGINRNEDGSIKPCEDCAE